jgi:hypothetical protein
MSALQQQILTLVGVLIGAAASFCASTAAERLRARREKQARWDLKRMETYAAYGLSVKTYVQLAKRICASQGLTARVVPLPLDEGLERLADAEQDRSTVWEQVLLLGDPSTINAARKWHESAWRLELLARGADGGRYDYSDLMAELHETRAEFYACARIDIGVKGHPPVTPWPRDLAVQPSVPSS